MRQAERRVCASSKGDCLDSELTDGCRAEISVARSADFFFKKRKKKTTGNLKYYVNLSDFKIFTIFFNQSEINEQTENTVLAKPNNLQAGSTSGYLFVTSTSIPILLPVAPQATD